MSDANGPILPPPRFSRPEPPAGRRSSPPDAPGGQPDPTSVSAELRWARDPVDEHVHLVAVIDIELADVEGFAFALCGRPMAAEWLTLRRGQPGSPCADCLAAASRRDQGGDR